MAKFTFEVIVDSDWTELSSTETTVLVKKEGGEEIQIAVAAADTDLDPDDGHILRDSFSLYQCPAKVFARTSKAGVQSRLTVTRY